MYAKLVCLIILKVPSIILGVVLLKAQAHSIFDNNSLLILIFFDYSNYISHHPFWLN